MEMDMIRIEKDVQITELAYDDEPISIHWGSGTIFTDLPFRALQGCDSGYRTFRNDRTKTRIDVHLRHRRIGIMTSGIIQVMGYGSSVEYIITPYKSEKETEEPTEEPKQNKKGLPEDVNPITLFSVMFTLMIAMLAMMISYMEVLR